MSDLIPIHFRLTLRGTWRLTPLDSGDTIRVIAVLSSDNNFNITVDDEGDNYVILEPDIGISCT